MMTHYGEWPKMGHERIWNDSQWEMNYILENVEKDGWQTIAIGIPDKCKTLTMSTQWVVVLSGRRIKGRSV